MPSPEEYNRYIPEAYRKFAPLADLELFNIEVKKLGHSIKTHITKLEAIIPPEQSLKTHTWKAMLGSVTTMAGSAIDWAITRNAKKLTDLLCQSAWVGDYAGVIVALGQGCDPNCISPHNNLSPIHIAAMRGQHECVKALLQAGAKVNTTTHYQDTPLLAAVRKHYEPVIKLLICAGAELPADYKAPLASPALQAAIACYQKFRVARLAWERGDISGGQQALESAHMLQKEYFELILCAILAGGPLAAQFNAESFAQLLACPRVKQTVIQLKLPVFQSISLALAYTNAQVTHIDHQTARALLSNSQRQALANHDQHAQDLITKTRSLI